MFKHRSFLILVQLILNQKQYQYQANSSMHRSYNEQQLNYGQTTSLVNFIPLEKIGEGSFSSVYKVRRITDDRIYALKKIKIASLKEKQKQNALNQIRILASLDSSYIVQYKQAFFDHKLNLLCIVMEFANDGDLQKKIEYYRKSMIHIPQNQIWKAAYQTLKGLDILHSKSILHRDIKSANIFIVDGKYKLGDLNVSKVQDTLSKLAYTQTGTPYYASPEVWRDEPYDNKSDIWSLGCVLYEMCTYRPPFKGRDLESLYKSVQRGLYDPLPIQYGQQLSQLISWCLRLNSKHRLTCKQLLSSAVMVKKVNELKFNNEKNEYNTELLKTIKLPNDLKDLKKRLPKSKYSSSTDNINFREDKEQVNEFLQINQNSRENKKQFNQDYYLQIANKKKLINLQPLKLNRVISEECQNGNPQQIIGLQNKQAKANPRFTKNIQSSRQLSNNVSDIQNYCEPNIRSSTPCTDMYQKQTEKTKLIIQKSKQMQSPTGADKQKYLISLKKTQQNKNRKLSHDQQCQNSRREMLNHLNLMKKLSQPHHSNNSLSQRYISHELMLDRENQNIIQLPEEKQLQQNSMKKLLVSKKSEELLLIEKKVEQKRRQLRKIGSIQRLQANSNKNVHNLSYRPTPPLVLRPQLKKSTAHVSSILLKSPVSTEDEQLSNRMKQKISNQKKLSLNNPVSSTPYLGKIGEVPRIKGLLQNMNEVKKIRETQLKHKILSSRYLHSKY